MRQEKSIQIQLPEGRFCVYCRRLAFWRECFHVYPNRADADLNRYIVLKLKKLVMCQGKQLYRVIITVMVIYIPSVFKERQRSRA